MALSENDIDRIVTRLSQGNICMCGEYQKSMGHLMGMFKDAGKGDPDTGIEVFRSMAKRYVRVQTTSDYIARGITYLLIGSMFGGALYVIKLGFQQVIKAMK